MFDRLTRIHHEFGFGASARMVLMIVGIVGMAIFGVLGFSSWWPALIALSGFVAGLLLRRRIVEIFEWTTWAIPTALFVYGVMLFVGERLGISREVQLMIMTLATVVVFDLQFWALSDPSIIKLRDDR
jgi:hypothetical protein